MDARPLPFVIAILILLAAGGALWFILNQPTDIEIGGGQATSTPVSIEKLYIQENGAYHEIDAAYPSATPLRASAGIAADAAAVGTLKFFAEQEVARFIDLTIDLTEEDVRVQGLGGERKYVLDMDYDTYESTSTVSYVYHMYADTLGAHPNVYFRTFTFDKESGEGVHLDDLFADDAYLEVLSAKTRASLRETLRENASPDMLEAGTTPFADNFQNFYIQGEAFVIVFPPYQVGPWAIGVQEVRIPMSELSSVLRAKYR